MTKTAFLYYRISPVVKKFLFLFLFLTLISSLSGIPLDQLPELVETRSKELEARRLDILTKHLDIKNQPFTYLPDLSLSYQGDVSFPAFEDFSHSHNFTLSSSLHFSDAQVFSDRIEILEYQKDLIEYDQYFQKLLFEAIELYIDALKKKVVYELAQVNESVSALNYDLAQSKNRQGTLSGIELLNAEADYDNSIYLSRKGKLDFDMALSSLRRKLNSPDLTIEDISLDNPAYILIEEITEHRDTSPYNIRIQEKQLKILKLNNTIALREKWLPQLNLGLSVQYDQYSYNSKTDEWIEMDPKINPALNISVSIPLFSRNEKTLAVKKSSIAIQKAQLDMDEMSSQLTEEVEELTELHNRSIDLLEISRKRVQSAGKEYEMKSESFILGITTILELYDTRDRYMEREKEALNFTLDILMLRARIGNTIGDTFLFIGDGSS